MDHDRAKAEEALILGRWLITECGGPEAALKRFSKRLVKMKGAEILQPLMAVIKDVTAASRTDLTPRQREALEDITRAFRLR